MRMTFRAPVARVRPLLVVASLLVVAAVSLTGCRSNVGSAATVNGERISESTVTGYLTSRASTAHAQGSGGQSFRVAPRSVVLQTLIEVRLLHSLVDAVPGRSPTRGEFATVRRSVLAGKSPAAFLAARGLTGYSGSFEQLFARDQTYNAILSAVAQRGVDVRGLLAHQHFRVSVSPRYGAWNPATLSILSPKVTAGLPGYLSFSSQRASTG